tara:strand:- start:794 stop:1003 length:210 start_codon:yes stop_codon:yes gene_type:complete
MKTIKNIWKKIEDINERWNTQITLNIIMILCIMIVCLLLSSCSTSNQCYNVGTGKPMTKTCGGGWTGGQ